MTELIVSILETSNGYDFIRSDGEAFSLVGKEDGHAVLYVGPWSESPAMGIVDLDISISDKLEAASKWVLAYPKHPD